MKHTVTFWSALLVTSVAANKNLAYFFSGTEEECKRDEWDTDDLWNKSSTARNMDGLHFMGGGCVDDQPTGEENKRKWIWLPNIQTVNNRNVYCLVAQEKTGCHDKDDGTCATMQLSVSRMSEGCYRLPDSTEGWQSFKFYEGDAYCPNEFPKCDYTPPSVSY